MEAEIPFLPEDERIQLEYLESLLIDLTPKNIEKITRKIKNVQFKTRDQLQHLSDLIFKFVVERPGAVKEYACLCKDIKDLKVTILRFETVDEKESLEIANLRFHILLKTRIEIAYDQLGAINDSFELFLNQTQNSSLVEVLRFVKSQMIFAGELYKYDLVTTEFLFAVINRLSGMADISEFFLDCMVSLMEQTAKEVEAQNYSLGRYFKQLRHIAINNTANSGLTERIKDLLKLRATKWLGGEEDVSPEYVENLMIDENYKQATLKAIEEELEKYISVDRCKSCCLEFEPSDRIIHLTSKQHTTSMQTLLRDQYDGNLISCRQRSCIICQEVDIERPFAHFNTQEHKINSTTYCYICQAKFTSAYYLSMHLKSLNHRKDVLKIYDLILETKLLDELTAKENDILASDDSDDNNDNAIINYEKYDRLMNENAGLKNNIFKYLDLITAKDQNKDEQELHERVMEQLDRFIENIYISKNLSTENTLDLLKQFNQEVEDVKAAVKCVKGEFPPVSQAAKERIVQQHNLVNILKDQYTELCEDMKKKLAELNNVKTEQKDTGEPSVLDSFPENNDTSVVDENKSTSEEKYPNPCLHRESQDMPQESKDKNNKDKETKNKTTSNVCLQEISNLKETFQEDGSNNFVLEFIDILQDTSDTKHTEFQDGNIYVMKNDIRCTGASELKSKIKTPSNFSVESKEKSEYNNVEIKSVLNAGLGKDNKDSLKEALTDTVTVQLNIGCPVVDSINLPSDHNDVETKLIGMNDSKEQHKEITCESTRKIIDHKSNINKEPIKQLTVPVGEDKATNGHEMEKKNNSTNETVQDNKITEEQHEGFETKKNMEYKKKKKSKHKNVELNYDNKTKVTHHETYKGDNVFDKSKTEIFLEDQQSKKMTLTTKGKINPKENSTDNQTPTFKINKEDKSCVQNANTVSQEKQGDNIQKKDSTGQKKDKAYTSPLSSCPNNHFTGTELSSVTLEHSFKSDLNSVSQGAQEKEDILEETRLFNLKKIKIKMLERLKRKIVAKLRSEDSGDKQNLEGEKVIIEVTSLIKKVYMSEDIPLEITFGLVENFNKDLESKITRQEKVKGTLV